MYLTLVALILSMGTILGQTKTEKIKVAGNCGMCKTRIEKAVKDVAGVDKALWDKKSKTLVFSYDVSKVKPLAIHKAVAAVGHDTELVQAEDKVYNSLSSCCKYERIKTKAK